MTLSKIPKGRVTTYGYLAEALGDVRASRWLGHLLLHHPHSQSCPCHRVVRSDGRLGTYVPGDQAKADRLRREGVEILEGRVDLARFGVRPTVGSMPLKDLREWQEVLKKERIEAPLAPLPRRIGGVDLSYGPGDLQVAAYAEIDSATGERTFDCLQLGKTTFPYIPTYLAYRELPLLVSLMGAVRAEGRAPGVVLVDGSGSLHPRGLGIACHLGVACDLPTIGVSKSMLCGRLSGPDVSDPEVHIIEINGRQAGAALPVRPGSKKQVFVSSGHRTDLGSSIAVVRKVLLGRPLPEPLYWADRISRQAVKRECA
jgi:deoxyribonuclease V